MMTATEDRDRAGAVTAAVGRQVRRLRADRGWSLDELAGRSGVSKGMLVQIEGARTNPSIGTLCRVADAFGVSITTLLEHEEQRVVRVSGPADAPVLWYGEQGGDARLLGGPGEPGLVELWRWRLNPGEALHSTDHPRGTRELLHILTGAVVVRVDGVDHPVRAGETIDLYADREHGYRNDGSEPATLIMVTVTPAGGWDRRSWAPRSRPPH